MISIRESVAELERSHARRAQAVDCYTAAIRSVAQYAIDLDEEITTPHRNYLNALAEDVSSGRDEVLEQSRSTFRALLRDYRDKATAYLSRVREELAATARALQETLSTFAQTDGDYESKLRETMRRLRQIASSPGGLAVRAELTSAADAIESSFEEMRKQHRTTVSQFVVEIQMLHRRIDTLETAAAVDNLTQLNSRADMEERLPLTPPGRSVLMVNVTGIRLAESRYPAEVAGQLRAAFIKRLRNMLPSNAIIGRWADEEFLAILTMKKSEALGLANRIAEHLSGAYSCVLNGKTVRPTLRLTVGVSESAGDRMLQHIKEFLPGLTSRGHG
jgi:GGDEF domain-containing protein